MSKRVKYKLQASVKTPQHLCGVFFFCFQPLKGEMEADDPLLSLALKPLHSLLSFN